MQDSSDTSMSWARSSTSTAWSTRRAPGRKRPPSNQRNCDDWEACWRPRWLTRSRRVGGPRRAHPPRASRAWESPSFSTDIDARTITTVGTGAEARDGDAKERGPHLCVRPLVHRGIPSSATALDAAEIRREDGGVSTLPSRDARIDLPSSPSFDKASQAFPWHTRISRVDPGHG